MKQLDGIIESMDMNLSKLREIGKDREACHAAVHRVPKIWTEKLSNNNDWFIVKFIFICICLFL